MKGTAFPGALRKAYSKGNEGLEEIKSTPVQRAQLFYKTWVTKASLITRILFQRGESLRPEAL